jgi:hypothetical protein
MRTKSDCRDIRGGRRLERSSDAGTPRHANNGEEVVGNNCNILAHKNQHLDSGQPSKHGLPNCPNVNGGAATDLSVNCWPTVIES